MIRECLPCQATTPEEPREPLNMSELPEGPWQHISMDFCGPLPTGEYLLVIVDEYSRYPVVEVVNSTSAKTVIPVVDKVFSMFGVPISVKTDNGPPFKGNDFLTLQNTWDLDTENYSTVASSKFLSRKNKSASDEDHQSGEDTKT